jgi:glutamyl-tRNA synthetase
MKETVLKFVLKNAFDYGSVNDKAVLGLVLRSNPEFKQNVPKVLKTINEVIKEIKGLSKEEIKVKLDELAPELLKEKKEETVKGPLKALPNAEKGKVKVRIAPSPSGALHVGHAYGASLNYEYAKMYEGKFILRIEDTNPDNIYVPAYDLIKGDANWLTENNVDEIVIQSSRLGTYYDYAEKLVRMGKAYVCICEPDYWRELKNSGEACPCRQIEVEEQQKRYARMFSSYTAGEAVLRLKTDIQHKNPAMRDFSIMRINEHYHPKTGKEQRVWPLMVLSVAIDDHELGITHVLNGKDHTDNSKKEALIMEYLGWEAPEYKHWGRINFEGFSLSASKTKIAIEQKEYEGWDDIRLPFLPALRRRGYQPEAFRKFAVEIGLSLNDKSVSKEEFWKMINSFNREIVEPKANRFFFVKDPVVVGIIDAPEKEVEMDLHPDFKERGKRKLNAKSEVQITEEDWKKLGPGRVHRLMDYCNFEIVDGEWKFVSENYEDYRNAEKKGSIIHWLPVEDLPKVEVLLEDNTVISGFGEKALLQIQEGEIIQFERYAFCKLDEKGDVLRFWYLHK